MAEFNVQLIVYHLTGRDMVQIDLVDEGPRSSKPGQSTEICAHVLAYDAAGVLLRLAPASDGEPVFVPWSHIAAVR